jgi:hypothetical protein
LQEGLFLLESSWLWATPEEDDPRPPAFTFLMETYEGALWQSPWNAGIPVSTI